MTDRRLAARRTRRIAAIAFSAPLLLVLADAARAADAEPGVDEIIVTGKAGAYSARSSSSATRTDTPLLEVPQAITVLSRQLVNDLNAVRVEDVLAYAGGITKGNNFGGTGLSDFNLRGFQSSEYFRNGFPMNRGYPASPDSVAVEQIDVLRGPAALMYGRGDPGGTFNIVTRTPSANPTRTISGQVNNFGAWRGSVDATGPLTGDASVRYRLGGAAEDGDSFRDHVRNSRLVVAPVLAWDPTSDLTIVLDGEFMRTRTPLDRGIPAYANQLKIKTPASRFLSEPSIGRWRTRNALGSLRAEYRLGEDWKIRVGTQYYAGDLGGPGAQFSSVQADGRSVVRTYSERKLTWRDGDTQINITGKFDTAGIEHQVLLGGEYEQFHYTEIIRNSNPTTNPFTIDIFNPVYGKAIPPLTGTFTSITEHSRTFAGYVQDQISLASWLKVLAGFRAEDFKRDTLNVRNGVTTNFKQTVVTPRLGVVFLVTPNVSLYGSYSRSNKPNTAFDINSNVLDPERGRSYEGGVKLELLGGAFTANAALFHTVKQNVSTADPVDPNFSIAAGEVRSRGVDLSFSGSLLPGWRVVGGYAYADAEVTRDNRLTIGQRLPNTPRHSASLLNVYELQGGALRGLGAGIGITYVGGRIAGTAATAPVVPSYTTANLLAYYPLTSRIKLQLNITNLFDRNYAERAFGSTLYPGAPFTATGRIAVSF